MRKKVVIQDKKIASSKPKEKTVRLIGLHNLRAPMGAHKTRKILGRGTSSGHGKTSTRGSKGQTSRSGRATYMGFEGGQTPLIRRFPKRGFNSRSPLRYQIVNLSSLSKLKAEVINPDVMIKQGLVKSKNNLIKILGDGELKKPVSIQAHAFSKSALKKIQEAGGKSEVINA